MRKIATAIIKTIVAYLKEIFNDELKVMDAFYRQYA